MSESSTPAGRVTLADLEGDPHRVLAQLRAAAPAAWVPVLGTWLVTGYDLAVAVLRDPRTFTVDDPRFSTAQVVGPSMLSLDGAPHAHHRGPFNRPFRHDEVHARLAAFTRAETGRLVSAIEPLGAAELRRAVAGPLAAAVMAEVLGLGQVDPATILTWYDGIVAAVQAEGAAASRGALPDTGADTGADGVTSVAAGGTAAFGELAASLREVIARGDSLLAEVTGPLAEQEAISNAAVLMFGGIETTEGMISNAVLHLLGDPAWLAAVRADRSLLPAAVAESLRLEPAAAVVDRYAAAEVELGGARVRRGDLVRVSIAGANRDPAVFDRPDEFDPSRGGAQHNLGFARGPHFCPGAQLASAETSAAAGALLDLLPGLRLDPDRPAAPRGLVFRKPPELHVRWDAPAGPAG